MNGDIVNKWAMGLAVFSFGFLSIGSLLFGATVITSVLRGLGGGVLFAALLWLVGLLINEEEDPMGDDIEEESETVLSAPVITDSDAVRDKFLNKSREISEKAEEEKKKEKEKQEAKEAKEATPF